MSIFDFKGLNRLFRVAEDKPIHGTATPADLVNRLKAREADIKERQDAFIAHLHRNVAAPREEAAEGLSSQQRRLDAIYESGKTPAEMAAENLRSQQDELQRQLDEMNENYRS